MQGTRNHTMSELNWHILTQFIIQGTYVVLSFALVVLPLIASVPAWIRQLPSYRNAKSASIKMLALIEDEEIQNPFSNTKVQVRVGYIKKGEKGFKELVKTAIALYEGRYKAIFDQSYKIPVSKSIKRIGVAVPTVSSLIGRFGNDLGSCLFLSDGYTGTGQLYPVLFERIAINAQPPVSLWEVPHLMRDHVQTQLQTTFARATAIIAIFWVVLMTLIIFG